jgi:hypothetical protein
MSGEIKRRLERVKPFAVSIKGFFKMKNKRFLLGMSGALPVFGFLSRYSMKATGIEG